MLSKRDTEISYLKVNVHQLSSQGPGTTDALKKENASLKAQVISLTEEVKELNVEVKSLTKQLLNAHAAESVCMDLVLYHLAPKHSPS